MVQSTNCIHVCSELNTWVDFMIKISAYEDFARAEKVVNDAFDDYWTNDDANDEAIADWIGCKLTENDIEFEIYFKDEEENY